ncbi:MAG: phospho-N-acetylmuramoyl-pentapeptide-transferase [Clostridia bacterium]|nr:phospho-N-acetylmuramoyl-pentapeptide-transferase [Clostridia bacterium]
MRFQMTIMIISFVVTVILAFVIIPILKKIKVGQIERDDGPQSHLKKQGTPTMGGIIFMISIIICVTAVYVYLHSINHTEIAQNLLPMLCLTIGFGVIGFIDDYKKLVLQNTDGLKPKNKMLGLLLISVAYALFIVRFSNIGTQTYLPIFKTFINLSVYLYIPFAILVILATTNAINLTDGIDGLSSSVSCIIIACLTAIAMMKGISEVVIFGSVVIGAVLGFLMFNLHPAKIFMGDTGSLFLGGVISSIALYLKMPLVLILIALIPILETLSVIIQVVYFKKTGGKRFFKMSPLHHHFELSGWSENKVVIIFSIITLLVCVLGIFSV